MKGGLYCSVPWPIGRAWSCHLSGRIIRFHQHGCAWNWLKKEIPLLNYLWDEVTWCSVHQWHHMTRWPTKFSTLERNWTDLPRKFVSLPGLFTRKCPWSSPPARIRRQAYGWGQPGFASGHPPGGRVAQGWGWELKQGGSERPLYRDTADQQVSHAFAAGSI